MSAPPHVPPAIERDKPATLLADIVVRDETLELMDGVTYTYWTFNGSVPGPMIRARVGDTLVVRFTNEGMGMPHSIDLHAVTGPGGGAVYTNTFMGGQTAFAFKADKPGLYVYHCATAPMSMHIANGMYGLILVEPEGGLPQVDREYYIMQQELYTEQPFGTRGEATLSYEKLRMEQAEYVVMNGAVTSLRGERGLPVQAGETVRIYFGDAGPNLLSSVHIVGEIMDRVYEWGSLDQWVETVQTIPVPPGGAAVIETTFEVPGTYLLVDHAASRMDKGAVAELVVTGDERPDLFRDLN